MLNLPDKLWEYFLNEEYQKLAHICLDLKQEQSLDQIHQRFVDNMELYALACDEWEKSYNFKTILEKLHQAETDLEAMTEDVEGISVQLCRGVAVMSSINQYAVRIENAMLFNDADLMVKNSQDGVTIVENALTQLIRGQSEILDGVIELIESYESYIRSWGDYSGIYKIYRESGNPSEEINQILPKLEQVAEEMIQDDDRITSSEIQALVANLRVMQKYWDSQDPTILINNSTHYLSTSFYTGNQFSDHIIEQYGLKTNFTISEKLFGGDLEVVSAGVDGLDDFLQTSIGEAYGDVFHVILNQGSLVLKGDELEFDVHLYIRRFGTASVVIEVPTDNLSVSDFRMIQTLIGPQAGITDITWENQEFERLDQINQFIYSLLLDYHKNWLNTTKLLSILQMHSAPYDADRTWFAKSIIREASLVYSDGRSKKIKNWEELEESYEFMALRSPLLEGRPSLNDWIQIPKRKLVNLAEVRLHTDDLVLFDTHTLLIFLPSKPDFILQGIISSGRLLNDISTLINGFDVMAEQVRSNLIHQVQEAKIMLEQVEIDKIKSDLKLLRRNVIEITEFELLALQSIQLLKSQSTIKYPDHAKFMIELINRSAIASTIESLEQKIRIIKESQEGILRTADDLVAKYQEEVSESQQRLVRVITLIGAGVAQITIIDDILSVFQNQGLLSSGSAEGIKLGVIILAFLLSGIAIGWLVWGYLRTKSDIFGEN